MGWSTCWYMENIKSPWKEKIKIHSDFFDYKYVNSILEKLTGNKIEFSNALIKY